MGTKTVARIRMEDGSRFIVDRKISRRPSGGRKATGYLYQYDGDGRERLEQFDARLSNTERTIEHALDAIEFYTSAAVDTIEKP